MAADLLMNAEVILPQGEEKRLAKVIKSSVDSDGKVIGNYNELPLLNTVLYDVQFPDGSIKPYSANLIAENILMQVDGDGLHHQLLEGILDHSKDKRAIEKKDKYFVSKHGRQSMHKTTVGWKFNIKWRDGTTKWVSLKDIKESNPIEVAEYVTARYIQEEPAFAWWVTYTLRKRDRIIASVKSCVHKSSHKYGIGGATPPRGGGAAVESDKKERQFRLAV